MLAGCSLLTLIPLASSCIWIWPLHEEVVAPPYATLSHCTPYSGRRRPVLISRETGERSFGCRVRAENISWRLTAFDPIAIAPYAIARDVESLRLNREDLPWSPRPYSVDLEMLIERDGSQTLVTWALIVAPDPDSLFEPDPTP